MKKYFFLLLSLHCFALVAQESQTINLKRDQLEAIFLQNNLQLLAEKMNIELAEAEIIQAKLWDNPELSIDQVNLWSTKSQRGGEAEVIPPLFGKVGKNTQFSIELSQLIQTANKRGRLVKREKVGRQIAEKEFEELLRTLKLELRQSVNETVFLQNYVSVLNNQQHSLQDLIKAYKKLVLQGNVAKGELLRLQSSLLQIDSEVYEVASQLNQQLSTLKVLLSLQPYVKLELEEDSQQYKQPHDIILNDLLELAATYRPDFQMTKLKTEYYDKTIAYEKSLKVPDITLSASYDRRGGVWRDYVGFGISVDLPVFNRNQGGIKAAKLGYQQSIYQSNLELNKIQHEVTNAYNRYSLAFNLYERTNDEDLLSELENMQSIYAKYLINKNISMLEYVDFIEAYKANIQTILTARKEVENQFQELQFTTGTDIN